MNRFIAQLFAIVLAAIHIIVIVALVLGLLPDGTLPILDEVRSELPGNVPTDPASVLGAFIGYVIVAGLASTFVAINVNLERLNRKFDQIAGLDEPA